jgi:sugar phosphate isomerase/epimerase
LTAANVSNYNTSVRKELAAIDASWPGMRHEWVLDLLAELGFSGVDVALWSGYTPLTPEDVRSDVAVWAGRVRERLETRGLVVSDVFPVVSMELVPYSINHPDASQREGSDAFFRDMLEFASHLEADHMTVLPGVLHEGMEYREALERSAEALRWRVEEAHRAGVALAIEGHVGSHVDTPEKILELLDVVPGLTLTLDFGHFAVQGMPDERAYPLMEHTSHFHVRGARDGFVQTRFDQNEIDFNEIVQRFADLGYNGWFTVEYVHDARPGCLDCDNIQETVQFRDFLRERIEDLLPT